MELTLEDLMVALQPKGLPDPILYQYYKNLINRRIIIKIPRRGAKKWKRLSVLYVVEN